VGDRDGSPHAAVTAGDQCFAAGEAAGTAIGGLTVIRPRVHVARQARQSWVCFLKGGFGYLERGPSMTGSLLVGCICGWASPARLRQCYTPIPPNQLPPRQCSTFVVVHRPAPSRRDESGNGTQADWLRQAGALRFFDRIVWLANAHVSSRNRVLNAISGI
jgi:hypothetical protein